MCVGQGVYTESIVGHPAVQLSQQQVFLCNTCTTGSLLLYNSCEYVRDVIMNAWPLYI